MQIRPLALCTKWTWYIWQFLYIRNLEGGSVSTRASDSLPLLKDHKSRLFHVCDINSSYWYCACKYRKLKFSLERWTGGQPGYLGKSQIWFKRRSTEPLPLCKCVFKKKGFHNLKAICKKLFKLSVNDVEGLNMWISQSIYGTIEESYCCCSFNKVFQSDCLTSNQDRSVKTSCGFYLIIFYMSPPNFYFFFLEEGSLPTPSTGTLTILVWNIWHDLMHPAFFFFCPNTWEIQKYRNTS